ncbi:MAG: RloB domain-containing protein [Bacteroidales bacterium]|nr:RloB domain-containing protein [Bacteroidales bacterium]
MEGKNTEKSYLDLLKKSNCKVNPITRKGHGFGLCVDFVNESEGRWRSLAAEERAKYDKRWLVFDYDGRPDFADGIKLAIKKGFNVVFSSMCIEYWFLLHFENHNGNPIPMAGKSHSAAQIDMINKHIRTYNKRTGNGIAEYDGGSKTVDEDFFDLMLATDPITKKSRIVTAFERAKAMHETKMANGAEYSESVTNMYELMLALGVIEKKKGQFELYRK